MRMCLGRVTKWRREYGRTGPLRFVFDRVSKGKGEIDEVFNRALAENAESALAEMGILPNGWSFEDKAQFIPIQAADILAWEALYLMKQSSAHGESI